MEEGGLQVLLVQIRVRADKSCFQDKENFYPACRQKKGRVKSTFPKFATFSLSSTQINFLCQREIRIQSERVT